MTTMPSPPTNPFYPIGKRRHEKLPPRGLTSSWWACPPEAFAAAYRRELPRMIAVKENYRSPNDAF